MWLLYATDRTNANTITKLILDMLIRFNLPVKNGRGQCVDAYMHLTKGMTQCLLTLLKCAIYFEVRPSRRFIVHLESIQTNRLCLNVFECALHLHKKTCIVSRFMIIGRPRDNTNVYTT